MWILLLGPAACSDLLGTKSATEIEVHARSDGLEVANTTSDSIGFRAVDRGSATNMLWAPCLGADCSWLARGDVEWVPDDRVHRWGESDSV